MSATHRRRHRRGGHGGVAIRNAHTARSSGEGLLTIINDVLDFSKIEAGKLDLEILDFDLRRVVEDVADIVAEPAHAKLVELVTLVAPDVPRFACGDPSRLRQVRSEGYR